MLPGVPACVEVRLFVRISRAFEAMRIFLLSGIPGVCNHAQPCPTSLVCARLSSGRTPNKLMAWAKEARAEVMAVQMPGKPVMGTAFSSHRSFWRRHKPVPGTAWRGHIPCGCGGVRGSSA
jgi:hypothetical protein